MTYSPPTLPANATLGSLHPAYVCSSLISSAATEATIQGVPPGQPFQVTVVALDKSGNPSASSVLAVEIAPPAAHGCSFSGAPAAPPVGLGLLTLALSLWLRRTRRRA